MSNNRRMVVGIAAVGLLLAMAQGSASSETSAPKESDPLDVSRYADERAVVERIIQQGDAERYTRAERLVMAGRSAAATGNFDVSSAAYLMFLNENRNDHTWRDRILEKTIESLAPINLKSIQIQHTPNGPKYRPEWRMNAEPDPASVRQAIELCKYAAESVQSDLQAAKTFYRLGWLCRATDDWEGSTAAWDECALLALEDQAVRALRYAADNEWWCGRSTEAIKRLEAAEVLSKKPGILNQVQSKKRMLQLEAWRNETWNDDPVTALKNEIAVREESPETIYREVVRWLERRHEPEAIAEISRWVASQSEWSPESQQYASGQLMTMLTVIGTDASQAELIDFLLQEIKKTKDSSRKARLVIRCSQLLREGERAQEALKLVESIKQASGLKPSLKQALLIEHAQVYVLLRDAKSANRIVKQLRSMYDNKEHPALKGLRKAIESIKDQEGY